MKSDSLKSIIKLSGDSNFRSALTEDLVEQAKYTVVQWIGREYCEDDIFRILLSLNLLNSAVKRKEYKKKISYGLIKSRAALLLRLLVENETANNNISFYINLTENCAYVEMRGLQFSFHQIVLKGVVEDFSQSDKNTVRPWRGIRLQKVAAELFRHFIK